MQQIKAALTSITGVTNWESINFGILPGEDPKGILLPASVSPISQAKLRSVYMVGILISSEGLQDLAAQSQEMAMKIGKALSTNQVCMPGEGGGLLRLTGEISIEIPQSYATQSSVSLTTGFFTSITFALEVL